MGAEVLGCRLRATPLNRGLGIAAAAECLVEGSLEAPRDAQDAASQALTLLEEALGETLSARGTPHWEYIGSSYNLYSYSLTLEPAGTPAGTLRVIELGGAPVAVAAALTAEAADAIGDGAATVGQAPPPPPVYAPAPVPAQRRGAGAPGQAEAKRPAVYAVEGIQRLPAENWRLTVRLPGGEAVEASLEDVARAAREAEAPLHCVTGWSLPRARWLAAPLEALLEGLGARLAGEWLAAISSAGYAAVLPAEEARHTLLAVGLNGAPLSPEHGAPVRLLAPRLYGWKHVKWLREIRMMESYTDGYWEALGYHERGLASLNERFKIRNPALARGDPPPAPPAPKPPR